MKPLNESTLIVCSIVRNAERGLRKNIPVVKEWCRHFKNFRVVAYENDSTDGTKELLKAWRQDSLERIHVLLNDTDASRTIPDPHEVKGNPFFSYRRISKMAYLRNQYLDYVERQGWEADYLMVVDLDVAQLYVQPVLDVLSENREWDVLTAFGYSRSPSFKRRYHDGYALTRTGEELVPQTERMIYSMPELFGRLRPSDDWVRVYSAFGGLSLYKYEVIKGLRYEVLPNDDPRVEVHCEHFSLCQQIHERGCHNIYVVPAMVLKYQAVTPRLIWSTLKRRFVKRIC